MSFFEAREIEMTQSQQNSPKPSPNTSALSAEALAEMARYGIVRIPVDYFHYGNFRYTNLDDAIAHVRHEQSQTD